jgi:NAD+ diphosphatase
MSGEYIPSLISRDTQTLDSYWFIFSGYRLLVKISGGMTAIPMAKAPEELGVDIKAPLYLGTLQGHSCYAADGEMRGEDSSDAAFQELRSLYSRLETGFYEMALTAVHLVAWDKNYQFCSKCRGALKSREDMRAKECEECGRLEFPRISPAIIVLIEKDDTLLLARSPRFAGEFFSVLAGFVEPGESLEDAVHREVKEEIGITIKNVAYFGSQPWPFPDSLMIGFTAEYESGEIRIDGEEIIAAGWYRADNMPRIPGKVSIAGKLIDWFVEKHSGSP